MSGYTNSYNAINLAGLPLPNVLEPIDFELEVTRIRAELSQNLPMIIPFKPH